MVDADAVVLAAGAEVSAGHLDHLDPALAVDLRTIPSAPMVMVCRCVAEAGPLAKGLLAQVAASC